MSKSKHTPTRTDEPKMLAVLDPTTKTERDKAVLRAMGANADAETSVESLRGLRAAMARPMPPKPHTARFHGKTRTTR